LIIDGNHVDGLREVVLLGVGVHQEAGVVAALGEVFEFLIPHHSWHVQPEVEFVTAVHLHLYLKVALHVHTLLSRLDYQVPLVDLMPVDDDFFPLS